MVNSVDHPRSTIRSQRLGLVEGNPAMDYKSEGASHNGVSLPASNKWTISHQRCHTTQGARPLRVQKRECGMRGNPGRSSLLVHTRSDRSQLRPPSREHFSAFGLPHEEFAEPARRKRSKHTRMVMRKRGLAPSVSVFQIEITKPNELNSMYCYAR